MRTGAQRRGSVPTEMAEACASLIRDPLLRLKFLRRARIAPPEPEPQPRRWWMATALAALAFLIAAGVSAPSLVPRAARETRPAPGPAAGPAIPAGPSATVARVWLVEQTPDSETYSNGLRIERQYAVAGQPRRYRAFARGVADGSRWLWRTEPAGIVFHSSESDILPFEPGQNGPLVEHGRGLLAFARERAAYHFIVDRFGRVHSVVEETAKADHAGHSIWADADWVYVNLNSSFLAICFEAQTRPGNAFSPAQIHAGKVLVEMLRSRYGILAGNCVTHAQVSVNPRNFCVGYHTDWATGFPFAEVGLPDNYELLPPSLLLFGFEADSTYVNLSGAGLRKAVSIAEEQVRQAAEARHQPLARYQEGLRKSYAAMVAAAGGPAAM
jgi:hypothetical protein